VCGAEWQTFGPAAQRVLASKQSCDAAESFFLTNGCRRTTASLQRTVANSPRMRLRSGRAWARHSSVLLGTEHSHSIHDCGASNFTAIRTFTTRAALHVPRGVTRIPTRARTRIGAAVACATRLRRARPGTVASQGQAASSHAAGCRA